MAMAATRAMDNMVVTVATKVMGIKVVMVGTKAMAMRATVATKAMARRGMVATKAMATNLIRVMANKATVTNRDMANKVTASRRDMVRTKVTAINKAMTATASSKVTQGAITEPPTDLTSHAPTTIRVMGSKETTVATRAMNSLGTASIRAPSTNSLATASSNLATLRTRAPSTSKRLATPSNRRSNTTIIPAEITHRKAATRAAAREGISTVTSRPSRTVKQGRGTPWTWRRTPTAARATATRTNTEKDSTLCRRLFSLVL